jgi:DNA-binding winged helix-turn-helix (wHTH) protein
MASSPIPARFAGIELDLSTGELRRNGALLKLQPQPARNLTILVSRVGEVVRRQELAREVWGSNKLSEHGKLLLMLPSADRSGAVGFRCGVDAE